MINPFQYNLNQNQQPQYKKKKSPLNDIMDEYKGVYDDYYFNSPPAATSLNNKNTSANSIQTDNIIVAGLITGVAMLGGYKAFSVFKTLFGKLNIKLQPVKSKTKSLNHNKSESVIEMTEINKPSASNKSHVEQIVEGKQQLNKSEPAAQKTQVVKPPDIPSAGTKPHVEQIIDEGREVLEPKGKYIPRNGGNTEEINMDLDLNPLFKKSIDNFIERCESKNIKLAEIKTPEQVEPLIDELYSHVDKYVFPKYNSDYVTHEKGLLAGKPVLMDSFIKRQDGVCRHRANYVTGICAEILHKYPNLTHLFNANAFTSGGHSYTVFSINKANNPQNTEIVKYKKFDTVMHILRDFSEDEFNNALKIHLQSQ